MSQNQNPNQSQNPNQNQSQNQGQNQKDQKSCQVCGQSFSSDRESQEHMKTAHQNKQQGEKQPGSERKQGDIDNDRGNREEKIA